jgi:hypothetical protein
MTHTRFLCISGYVCFHLISDRTVIHHFDCYQSRALHKSKMGQSCRGVAQAPQITLARAYDFPSPQPRVRFLAINFYSARQHGFCSSSVCPTATSTACPDQTVTCVICLFPGPASVCAAFHQAFQARSAPKRSLLQIRSLRAT